MSHEIITGLAHDVEKNKGRIGASYVNVMLNLHVWDLQVRKHLDRCTGLCAGVSFDVCSVSETKNWQLSILTIDLN